MFTEITESIVPKALTHSYNIDTLDKSVTATSQKTPYSQRLSSIVKHILSPLSDGSTYRAERAHVIPTFSFPSSSINIENKNNKRHDYYEDIITPISSKRPSHNLLSNIVPSTTPSSSDRSGQ